MQNSAQWTIPGGPRDDFKKSLPYDVVRGSEIHSDELLQQSPRDF